MHNRLIVLDTTGEMWEVDGSQQVHRMPSGGRPGPSRRPGMVFDSIHHRVLLFGGLLFDGSGWLSDTFYWDGESWMVGSGPAGRSQMAMSFDSVRGRTVLYGGIGFGPLFDTWEHDGFLWQQRTPVTVPQVSPIGATFDPVSGKTLMLGFSGAVGLPLQLWEWNGNDWLRRQPSGSAPTRTTVGAFGWVFDVQRSRAVLLLGTSSTGREVWEWDGTTWALRSSSSQPIGSTVAYYDPQQQRSVFLGRVGPGGVYANEVWSWDGIALTQVGALHSPPMTGSSGTWVADSLRNRIVMLARVGGVGETWEWDGLDWQLRTPAFSPPLDSPGAVFDSLRGRTMVFGGFGSSTDLWSWDGTAWTRTTPALSPTGRTGAAMAYDAARDRVVLFGGTSSVVNSPLGDTWEWDGTAWLQRAVLALAPASRSSAAMVWDPVRARTVLFGSDGTFADTWEWDGTSWTPMSPLPSPPVMSSPSLMFDPGRGRVVLAGTRMTWTGQNAFDAHEYTGIAWTLISSWIAEDSQRPFKAAMDPARQRIVAHDGIWVRELTAPAAAAAVFGQGCGSPVPALSVNRPRVGASDFALELDAVAGQPALFALSLNQASVPIGSGCTVLIGSSAVRALSIAGPRGIARHAVPIPMVTALRGTQVFAQAACLDPSGTVRLSRGRRLVVGD